MGLDTSHDCWHGAYGAFNRWRKAIAHAAGLPPLMIMDGFYEYDTPLHDPWWRSTDKHQAVDGLPIKWEALRSSPLHILLHHSDCDGEIAWQDCAGIADELEKLLPNLPQGDAGGHIGDYRDKTKAFIEGLRLAASAQENVIFH